MHISHFSEAKQVFLNLMLSAKDVLKEE